MQGSVVGSAAALGEEAAGTSLVTLDPLNTF